MNRFNALNGIILLPFFVQSKEKKKKIISLREYLRMLTMGCFIVCFPDGLDMIICSWQSNAENPDVDDDRRKHKHKKKTN